MARGTLTFRPMSPRSEPPRARPGSAKPRPGHGVTDPAPGWSFLVHPIRDLTDTLGAVRLTTNVTNAPEPVRNALRQLADEITAWRLPGEDPEHGRKDQAVSDPARVVEEIRAILAAFDWEQDDRQYALEAIERIVTDQDQDQDQAVTEPGQLAVALGRIQALENDLRGALAFIRVLDRLRPTCVICHDGTADRMTVHGPACSDCAGDLPDDGPDPDFPESWAFGEVQKDQADRLPTQPDSVIEP